MLDNITIYTKIGTNDSILRKAIHTAFNGQCFYTGRNVSLSSMHIDHIQPVKYGGENCIANYVLSCAYINLKKNGKYNDDFVKITTELNKMVFANDVLSVYKNLFLNNKIKLSNKLTENHIILYDYLKSKNISDSIIAKVRNYAVYNNMVIKAKTLTKTNDMSGKNTIFILKTDADNILSKYLIQVV
jgi:hypothetical protein